MGLTSPWEEILENYLWRRGIRADLFVNHLKLIEQTIKENKLTAVPKEHMMIMKKDVDANEILDRRWWYGGMRVPHLHWKGDTFILNEKQWGKFTEKLINQYKEKLANVHSVSFDQLIELSEAIDPLVSADQITRPTSSK